MGPTILQRSGRGRLGDHNLFLDALFRGRLIHRRDGNLSNYFERSLFIDIGSALLTGDGAPTCRDLWEDERVRPHLADLIATDINDPDSRYVDQYLAGTNRLPFPVKEIPLALTEIGAWSNLVGDSDAPLMIRSANSGPDLYYESAVLSNHFRCLLRYAQRRPLLYFFSVFVVYKGAQDPGFQILGVVDRQVGFNHRGPAWTNVEWSRRDLSDPKVFYPWACLKVSPAAKNPASAEASARATNR